MVSIITPSYNSAKFISKTIDSVIAQTYQDWEMIIVDDCSSDNSIEIIEKYLKKDSRIKLIKLEKNSGAAIARNTAIESAKGRFIAFLDSDDLWYKDKLKIQITFMKEENVALSYSAYDVVNENDTKISEFIPPLKLNYKDLLKTNPIGCLTAIYDSKILSKVYMPNIRKRQDYALWLKILKQGYEAKGLENILARYRVRNNSISSNKIKAAIYQWKIYKEVEKLNIFSSVYYFVYYAVNGVFKYK